jgi:hypothetical protein
MTQVRDMADANQPRKADSRLSASRSTEEAFLIQSEYVRMVLLAHTAALCSSLLALPTEPRDPAARATSPQRRAA